MGRLTLILCDAAGNALPSDGPLVGVTGASVTLEQLDLFEGHQATISGDFRRNLAAIAPWTTVKIVESGIGVVAWGVIVNPSKQINDTGNSIVLTMPNITEQMRLSDTSLGWIASTGIGTIVGRLGALKNGWSAQFVDTGPNLISTGPVQWTPTGATAAANTLTKTGTAVAYDAGGVSQQSAASGDCAVAFVVLSTATSVICGIDHAPGMPTPASIDFGIIASNGNMSVTENGVTTGTLATVAVGDILRVSVESGQVKYYKNNLLVRNSAVAPTYPFYVAGLISDPNAQLGGVIFTRLTTPAEAWYAIRFEQSPILGALMDLATQTFHHVRLAKRAASAPDGSYLAGDPYRSIEFGTFGAPSALSLISATGGSLSAINANPDVRIITDFQRNRDATNVINSIVPLGGGTGDTQVTIERCWRIVNDPTYPNYGKYGNVPGTVFPEYDPLYPLPAIIDDGGVPRPARRNRAGSGMEISVTLDGRYEYRLADPASMAYWDTVMPGEGEMRGQYTDSQFVYVDQTPGNQEVTARALNVAAKTKLRYASMTNDALTVTTTGIGRVSRAGDLVHVQYRRTGKDADGIFVEENVDADYTVMGVKRAYDDKGPVHDTWLLSDKGTLSGTNQSTAASAARTMQALQLVPTTGLALLPVSGASDCDSTHPYDRTIPMPAELFRVRSAPLHVEFKPVRHNVSVAEAIGHQHDYTIPALTVTIPTLTVNLPSLAVNLPSLIVNLPALIVNIPALTVNLPSLNVNLPSLIVNLPALTVNIPALAVSLPSLTVAIPALTVYSAAFPIAGNQYAHTHGNGVNDLQHNHGGVSASNHGHGLSGIHDHSHGIGFVPIFIDNTPNAPAVGTKIPAWTTTATHTHSDSTVHASDFTGGPGNTASDAGAFSYSSGNQLGGVPNFNGFGTLSTYPTNIQTPATGQLGGGQGSTTAGALPGAVPASGNGNPTGNTTSSANAGGQGSTIPSSSPGGAAGTTVQQFSSTIASGGPGGSPTGNTTSSANAGGQGSTIPSGSPGGGQGSTVATPAFTVPVGSTTNPALQTIIGGVHSHTLTPGIVDSNTQMSIQLWVDSGDGNFVDRSPQLGGPWTGSFDVADLSPYVQAPGRKVRLRIQPTATQGQIDGLGAVELFGTWVCELGGVSSVVYAQ